MQIRIIVALYTLFISFTGHATSVEDWIFYNQNVCPLVKKDLTPFFNSKSKTFTLFSFSNYRTSHPTYNIDGSVNAVIEIPAGCQDKWEVNEQGQLEWSKKDYVHRVINYLPYIVNYGMISSTLSKKENGGDGDPLDILVLGPTVRRGEVVPVLPIGVLVLKDRNKLDYKVIATQITPFRFNPYQMIKNIEELEVKGELSIIKTWFSNYKFGQNVKIEGFLDASKAKELVKQNTI